VERMIDPISPTYDRLYMQKSASLDRGWRCKAVRSMRMKDRILVLYFATGTGDMALLTVETCHNGIVGTIVYPEG
jgi:demethylmenaquinone methyltransferase/2-methoxy-6-polyprenyl-1,4-benzoquinol methylase